MSTLQKSLVELIDETLNEIEQLKKSERYSAHEFSLGDEKANGSVEAQAINKGEEDDKEKKDKEKEEAKKSEKDDEDEEDEEDNMSKAEMECKKAEEAAEKAMKKYEMCKAESEHKKKMLAMKKGEKEEDKKEEKEDNKEDKKEDEKELKKSIDARVAPLEAKIADVLQAVKKLADAPVAARGTSFRNVQPLAKSQEVESLSKSEVFEKLFTLKKTGTQIPTEAFIELEQGSVSPNELATRFGISK